MEIWKFGDSSFAIFCGLISIHNLSKMAAATEFRNVLFGSAQ